LIWGQRHVGRALRDSSVGRERGGPAIAGPEDGVATLKHAVKNPNTGNGDRTLTPMATRHVRANEKSRRPGNRNSDRIAKNQKSERTLQKPVLKATRRATSSVNKKVEK